MPFKSRKMEAWMKVNKPEIYKRWLKKYGSLIKKRGKKVNERSVGG